MGHFEPRIYIVQKADPQTRKLTGEILAVKLSAGPAHKIAKQFAPAKVTCIPADKTDLINNPEHPLFQLLCK